MRIGAYLEYAWDVFMRHTAALVAAAFCLELVQIVVQSVLSRALQPMLALASSLLLTGLAAGGLMIAAQKARGGQSPTLADAFAPFRERQGDYLLVGLALGGGLLACGVGVLVTGLLFLFAPLLVAQGADYKDALIRSKDLVVAHLGDCVVLFLVLGAINAVGVFTVVGWLASLPISAIVLCRAYEELSRPEVLPAGADPTPGSTGS